MTEIKKRPSTVAAIASRQENESVVREADRAVRALDKDMRIRLAMSLLASNGELGTVPQEIVTVYAAPGSLVVLVARTDETCLRLLNLHAEIEAEFGGKPVH